MRRIAFLTALAVLLLAVPATAGAAVRHVLKGAGFGHGIGMSQYGAYGYALEGTGYKEILDHYYTGTRLESAPSRPVRVLLQPSDPYIRFRGATSAGGVALRPGTTYVARRSGSGISLRTASGKRVGSSSGALRATAGGDRPLRLLGPALNSISDGLYRGAIEVIPDVGGVTAINVIDLDPYVKGVVAGEMPSSWPLEALKVQAVAARTYALATRKTTGTFDQYPDTRSQVYKGVAGEAASLERRGQRDRGPDPHLQRRAGRDLLLLHLGRSHRERRVLVHRRADQAVAGRRARPVRLPLPLPPLAAVLLRRDARRGARRARPLRAAEGPAARRVAARRARSGRRHERLAHRHGPTGARGARARRHVVHRRPGEELRRAAALRPPGQLGAVVTPSSRSRASSVPPHAGRGSPFSAGPPPAGARVARVRTSRLGRYRVSLATPGVYRVKGGSVAGPAVRVR